MRTLITLSALVLCAALATQAHAQPPTPPAGAGADAPAGAPAAPVAEKRAEAPADQVAIPDQPPENEAGTGLPPNTGEPVPPALAIGSAALRQKCEQAITEDTEWRTELKENLAHRIFERPQNERDEALRDMVRLKAHEAETERLTRNNDHVIYAYGALWILTALFVLYMFVRQRSLNEEIAGLKRELEKAL